MDWKTLFLTANGRIGQRDFWIGFAILFVAGLVLGMIPVLGALIGLALIYPTVCVFSKRLHDSGRSGWLAAVPYAIGAIGMVLMMLTGGAGMMAAMMGRSDAASGASMLAGFGAMGMIGLLMFCAYVAYVLWVGLARSDPGENRYGPPPVSLTSGTTPTAA
ncbi:MAG TPA: DUF805 domain-containing protein [Caulobacteraceae bacterium]|jgi:uncharacterized membrane protein YhaH (DUF805 family)